MRFFGFSPNAHRIDLATAYADRELRGSELERYEAHLGSCERCQEFVADARAIRAAVTALPQVSAPRSFALTPEMVAGARPARLPAATPLYLNLARAGAALSVAAFGTVAAVGALGSSANDSSTGSDGDGSVSLTSAEAPETNEAAYDSGTGGGAPEAQSSPQLAPATSSAGVSGSSGTVAPLASTPVPPATGRDESATPTMVVPQPPMTGPGGVTNERDLGAETTEDDAFSDRTSTDTSASPLPEALRQESDNDGSDGLLIGFGALAGVAVIALGVLELARRRRA